MADRTLNGCRILVVEDEYILATELETELRDERAEVIGPAGSVEGALEILRSEPALDGAILDVSLGGEPVFPVADVLVGRAVPFVFTTGYDPSVIPERFQQVVRCEKPINIARVKQAIGRVIHA